MTTFSTAHPRVEPLLTELAQRVPAADTSRHRDIVDAMTGQQLGQVPHCTADDVVAAAARARAVQAEWAARPVSERAAVMLRLHDLVLEHQDEVLDLIQLENGKARRHAFEEVIDVALTARYYAHIAEEALRPKRRQGVQLMLTEVWEHYHPKGIVGIISPWNYPLTLGISDALPAIVAGNAVLAKPDDRTPFSHLWAVRLLERAGMPHGLVQSLTGPGRELGTSIIEQSDYLMFTGSTSSGRVVAQQAAERLIDYSMELGGKNALLVLDDADVDKAARGAVKAAFSNAGQLCISIERIYVPGALWDQFIDRFVRYTNELKLCAALDYSADMGTLINQTQLDTVIGHVDDAANKGATVLAGGRARPEIGPFFYEPTILSGVTDGMDAYLDETFGPVVSVYRVDSEEEAIAKANDSRFGLNFSVWTTNPQRGREVAAKLQAGTVNVNEAYAAAWASVDAPMGGMKDSGVGRRHGEHGMLKYTEAQTIAVERGLPVGVPPWLRADRYAKVMTVGLKALRRIPGVK
ncbi:succinic semialdehyde dehydrogenase [Mycobacterium sp. 852013-51886_SCH5428379]|uniref:succinic semialdehyde dehydrogenase n=1 Tax=Mycobacterium sp. 852013-51886_SCH5428379 TaxID=1834111 RepID=UPI0007FEF75F|nr:succinic semialdehyde dehydrogenase [Mycobacterium sp. 852013-51886_SCH5428379]OBB58345.1 succinic semialdehyde dehydrogenase [Mycobacterium sp. 852013-51886_SCH5428379]